MGKHSKTGSCQFDTISKSLGKIGDVIKKRELSQTTKIMFNALKGDMHCLRIRFQKEVRSGRSYRQQHDVDDEIYSDREMSDGSASIESLEPGPPTPRTLVVDDDGGVVADLESLGLAALEENDLLLPIYEAEGGNADSSDGKKKSKTMQVESVCGSTNSGGSSSSGSPSKS